MDDFEKVTGDVFTIAGVRHRIVQHGRRRSVVGPGTRLPSLGHVAYDPIEAALAIQCAGLLAGGVDGILIITPHDAAAQAVLANPQHAYTKLLRDSVLSPDDAGAGRLTAAARLPADEVVD